MYSNFIFVLMFGLKTSWLKNRNSTSFRRYQMRIKRRKKLLLWVNTFYYYSNDTWKRTYTPTRITLCIQCIDFEVYQTPIRKFIQWRVSVRKKKGMFFQFFFWFLSALYNKFLTLTLTFSKENSDWNKQSAEKFLFVLENGFSLAVVVVLLPLSLLRTSFSWHRHFSNFSIV